jgi:cardiolipin synthase A/B
MMSLAPWIEAGLAWIWANLFVVMGWVIALMAFVLIPFRRSPSEARGWLLLFFALPWLAVVLYGIVGRPTLPAKREQRLRKLPELFESIASQTGISDPKLKPELSPDNDSIARLSKGLGSFGPVKGNSIKSLSSYEGAFDGLIEDIGSAQHHVHLQFYIFANDRVGKRIMAALEEAQVRGVTCRVLIDALGSFGSIAAIKRRLKPLGIEVEAILPLRRRLRSSRVDLRNHRKIAVIDGRVGYTGSQNLWDPSVDTSRKNRDIFLRLTGPIVVQLQSVFVADWYLETLEELLDPELFPLPAQGDKMAAQIVASGPDYPEAGIDLIFAQAMHNAAQEIVITSPYFIPNEAILSAIKAAILGGVQVSLITARKSDHRIAGLAQRSYYRELLELGMSIYLCGPEFLHAKHLRVDQEVSIVGSSNMDVRSFELNAEADLICYDGELAAALKELEADYCAQSSQLQLEEWAGRPLISKVLENSSRLMSELI